LRAVTAALDGFAEMMQPVEAERDVLRTTVTALTAELAEARGRMAALETAPPAEALPAATPDDAASIAT
jgi:hypothetical protein